MSEKLEFKAELKQLLHLITHSLYSNPEIFLRELISNASDAINKIKFDSLSHDDILEDDKDWKIKISTDREAGTLTISDNGVGMTQQEVIDNLGTIARSGTKAFLEAIKAHAVDNRPDLIGQFGVGFYSSFMVADKVTVLTPTGRRRAKARAGSPTAKANSPSSPPRSRAAAPMSSCTSSPTPRNSSIPGGFARSSKSFPTSSSIRSSWTSRKRRRKAKRRSRRRRSTRARRSGCGTRTR